MRDLGLIVTPIDPRQMPEAEVMPSLALLNVIRREQLPDDPPLTTEEHRARLSGIPAFVEVQVWLVRAAEGGPLVASGDVAVLHDGQNPHVAFCNIEVHPDWRGRGIGRMLLGRIAPAAREKGRTLLMAHSNGRVPAGAAFLQSIGAERGLEATVSQLDMALLNPALLRRLRERGAERGADAFELGWWDGPYPESEVGAVAELFNSLFRDVPHGDLRMAPPSFTPERIREREASMATTGTVRWSLWARDRPTGAYAALTGMTWSPHRPFLMNQGLTGVLPAFREKGLGRLLKAVMLERVLAERPQVRFVRTDNADSNAAMLGINRELGFRPYDASTAWQVPVERVEEYLRGRAAAPVGA